MEEPVTDGGGVVYYFMASLAEMDLFSTLVPYAPQMVDVNGVVGFCERILRRIRTSDGALYSFPIGWYWASAGNDTSIVAMAYGLGSTHGPVIQEWDPPELNID